MRSKFCSSHLKFASRRKAKALGRVTRKRDTLMLPTVAPTSTGTRWQRHKEVRNAQASLLPSAAPYNLTAIKRKRLMLLISPPDRQTQERAPLRQH